MTTNLAQLIDRFEKDIIYSFDGTYKKVNGSAAAQKLVEIADRNILATLAHHLRDDFPLVGFYSDLPNAWCMVLSDFSLKLNLRPVPHDIHDLPAWIDWAEQNGQSAPSEQASPLT
jgi:hypothetical protein